MFRLCVLATLIFAFAGGRARADTKTQPEAEGWSVDLNFQHYVLPHESNLTLPVVSLYHGDWLIEGRYNYEDRDVASLWLGHTFSWGEEVTFDLTPMAGIVFVRMFGVSPGLKADFNWDPVNIYSEMEYVFDVDTRDNNFFYSWSEVTVRLTERLRAGIVGTRTRAYQSSVEIDRGPIIGYEFDRVDLSLTVLNIDETIDDAIYVLGAAFSFGG